MAKGNRMEAFWASVANLKRPQMKEASTQTVEPGFRGEVEGAGGGGGVKIITPRSEVGEPDLEEIILKLEAGHWRSPVTQIKKSLSLVAEVSSGSESELASTTASYNGP